MEHIKQALNKRIRQSGFSNQISTSMIIEEFKVLLRQKMGDKLSKKIKPLYLKNNVLTVVCVSSVMAQEANFLKSELIKEINSKFGAKTLQDIRFIL